SGDAGFVVLLDEANYSFEADGKSHTTQRHMVRILDDSAIEALGTIEVPWAPWYNDRPTVQARVVSKDGTVHTLDAKAITEAPARDDVRERPDRRAQGLRELPAVRHNQPAVHRLLHRLVVAQSGRALQRDRRQTDFGQRSQEIRTRRSRQRQRAARGHRPRACGG